ncbi:MAG: WD40/YVTN/BNR-like repeat-containing protein, partial [Candidatus Kapaibacterium sp.]
EKSGTLKYLKSVSFPTPNFGWAVGDSGIVLSTEDGGSTWTIHPFSKKRSFTGIAFPDSLHGYMCCEHGVYITADGGATWSDPDDFTYYIRCSSISSPSANVVSFSYWPCQTIFDKHIPGLLLTFGGVMTSNDGGKNWFDSEFNDFLYNVFFTDDLHGTAVGYFEPQKLVTGFIVHTTDGGKTWVQQDSHATDFLYGVAFGSNKAGTAVGSKGNIIRITTDE